MQNLRATSLQISRYVAATTKEKIKGLYRFRACLRSPAKLDFHELSSVWWQLSLTFRFSETFASEAKIDGAYTQLNDAALLRADVSSQLLAIAFLPS